MRRVGGKFVQRRIDRQPEAAVVAFVEVHLGPRVVVERAADKDEADRDARRNADRAGHGDKQRRVLVAVANFRPQHFARRRDADGRLLLEQAVDVARQPLRLLAAVRGAADRLLCFGDDLRRVAFDKRLWREVVFRRRISALGFKCPRVADFHDRPAIVRRRLRDAVEIGIREIRARESHAQPADIARLVDAFFRDRHDRRGFVEIALHLNRHGHQARALGRLAHGDEPQRAFFADDFARIRDPRHSTQPRIFHLDAKGRNRPARVSDELALADVDDDRRVVEGGRIEDRPVMAGARHEAAVGETPREVERQRRRLAQDAHFRARAADGLRGQRQPQTVHGAVDFERAGSRVERKLERLQPKAPVHMRRCPDRRGRGRAQQRHLQASVLFEIETVTLGDGLADREPDFFAAVVHAPPRRARSVAGQIGGEVRRGLKVGAVDEHRHDAYPGEQDENGNRLRDAPGERPHNAHC